jgi:hypothetical protein
VSDIIRKAFYNAADREFKFGTFQDVGPILEENKALRSQEQTNSDLRHKARIPLNVLHMWLQEAWDHGNSGIQWGSEEFDLLINRKLADPDWAHLLVDGPRHRVGYQ